MTELYSDTIAAISTGMTDSGIGIVRMTGPDAFLIIDQVYQARHPKKLSSQESHTIHYGFITDRGEILDEVLVMLMRGPYTYTGEDTVEINCHGGVYVVRRVLETLLRSGARPAQPGEFTKRAFLNGKLDLSQAEAVGDLITSQNEYALQSSISQLKGSLKKKINDIRNKIIYHTAFIESALDDPEHISVEHYGEELHTAVDGLLGEIGQLLDTYDNGKIITEGIQTVILGKPNVGKSSLLNVLTGEERAIVTDIAGTTRDVLEEHINLRGITLKVLDTAGIRQTEDVVEKMGVEKAKAYAEKADLLVCVIDASSHLDENDLDILRMLDGKPSVILLNKSDLDTKIKGKDIKEALYAINPAKYRENALDKLSIIEISAKENLGIDRFEGIIENLFFAGKLAFNNEIYITNARHKAALESACHSLRKVNESIKAGMPEDFYSIDLMDAYEALGSITGETVGEDLINEIFSKFCMGK